MGAFSAAGSVLAQCLDITIGDGVYRIDRKGRDPQKICLLLHSLYGERRYIIRWHQAVWLPESPCRIGMRTMSSSWGHGLIKEKKLVSNISIL